MNEINRKMAFGAFWMILMRFLELGLGFVSTLILARLLLPADFGLIAMATSFIAIIELFGAFGFDIALIQNQQAERRHFDTAWTLNVMLGVVSALLLAVLALPLAGFYDEPRLEPIIYTLAVGSLIYGFENIGVVVFRKELDFRREFKFLMAKKLLSFAVTVPLAFVLRNYWALVWGILVSRIGSLAISYFMHPYRPRLSLRAWGELVGFSKWLLLNNTFLFFKDRAADFVIGRIQNARVLGLYTLSYEISNLPTTGVVMPINRAVYPGYAKMSGELAVLRQGFIDVVGLIALVAVPAGAGIAAVAPLLVPLFLGGNWLEAIPYVELLAYYGVITAVQTNSLSVYIALGQPRMAAVINGIYVALLVPALIVLTSEYGGIGAAYAAVGTAVVMLPTNMLILANRLELPYGRLVRIIVRPLLGTAAMVACVSMVVQGTSSTAPLTELVTTISVAVAVGIVTYVAVVGALWLASGSPAGPESVLLSRVLRNRGVGNEPA